MNTGVKRTKKVSTKPSAIERRKSALQRLETQLKSGVKTKMIAENTQATIPLEEKDITRINNEINILKQRI